MGLQHMKDLADRSHGGFLTRQSDVRARVTLHLLNQEEAHDCPLFTASQQKTNRKKNNNLCQSFIVQLCFQLQSSRGVERWQPMGDHRLASWQRGKTDQNPLL